MLSGVSSLLIFSAPTLVVGFIDLGCRFIVGELEYQEQCTAIAVYMPYLRELLLYHLVYHPMSYMIRSKEFSSTLDEKWTRMVRHHHLQRDHHPPAPADNQVV